jgi:hypothetical protein
MHALVGTGSRNTYIIILLFPFSFSFESITGGEDTWLFIKTKT